MIVLADVRDSRSVLEITLARVDATALLLNSGRAFSVAQVDRCLGLHL